MANDCVFPPKTDFEILRFFNYRIKIWIKKRFAEKLLSIKSNAPKLHLLQSVQGRLWGIGTLQHMKIVCLFSCFSIGALMNCYLHSSQRFSWNHFCVVSLFVAWVDVACFLLYSFKLWWQSLVRQCGDGMGENGKGMLLHLCISFGHSNVKNSCQGWQRTIKSHRSSIYCKSNLVA